MYDRGTNSLWHSLTGEPVVGELAHSGKKLKLLPNTVTTWAEWLESHPDTSVLAHNTGFERPYLHPDDRDAVYNGYFRSKDLMFPVFELDPTLEAKRPVYALRFGEDARAYDVNMVAELRTINDTFAGRNLVVVGDPDAKSARAYDRGEHTFTPGETPRLVVDESGNVWQVDEERLTPPSDLDEAPLERLPGHQAFWFGWTSFFPQTDLYSP